MKMDKKTKGIVTAALLVALSAFGASKYGIDKSKNIKTTEVLTYAINSQVLQSESKEMANSFAAGETKPAVQEQKTMAVESQPAEIKAKQTISRGGSGVSKLKAQVKAQPKVQTRPKTQQKPATKTTAAVISVQANKEKDLFYRLVSAEAEGELFAGKLAVATVIMNRVKSPNYANTITGVIMDKKWGYQFTPVLDGRINNPPTASAKKAVDMVLNGYRSFGSDVFWFVNPDQAESPWIMQNKTLVKSIGNHDFYR